tara:strand:- start:179 stop:676 length:498 start_codon:yes stop_codon:yes gene_type:complete
MEDAAKLICRDGGRILNVGFGLGIIDRYIQSHNPQEHWIIEAHPQVIEKMKKDGWDKKPNIICIFDKWQNVLETLPKFDGIYFDTWQDISTKFTDKLNNLLNIGGKYLYFNGKVSAIEQWKELGYEVEVHKTILDNIDDNQTSNNEYYWSPTEKDFFHQLIIKEK